MQQRLTREGKTRLSKPDSRRTGGALLGLLSKAENLRSVVFGLKATSLQQKLPVANIGLSADCERLVQNGSLPERKTSVYDFT